MIDENRVREIVREELEGYFVKALREAVSELSLVSQDLRHREAEHDAKLDQALKELSELKEFAKNLAKVSEENTRAIVELRKQTEENTKAIVELRKAVEGLVIAVKSLNQRVGGLENTFGLIMEDTIRESLPRWFKEQGVDVGEVTGKEIQLEGKLMEFDVYVEYGNRVYLGEVKVTLRERDVKKFYAKVGLAKVALKDKEVVPILIYRVRAKGQNPVELAKAYGIEVLKYVKGGAFRQV